MMKLRRMVEWFAAATGLPEKSVNEIARILQKSGLIKTGKPGRYGGAAMDEKDAAALVLAILAAEGKRSVVDAADVVRTISGSKTWAVYDAQSPEKPSPSPVETLFGLPSDHTLMDLVCELIRREPTRLFNAHGNLVLGFEISMRFPGLRVRASFTFGNPRQEIDVVYWSPDEDAESVNHAGFFFQISRTINGDFFSEVHRQIFDEPKRESCSAADLTGNPNG